MQEHEHEHKYERMMSVDSKNLFPETKSTMFVSPIKYAV